MHLSQQVYQRKAHKISTNYSVIWNLWHGCIKISEGCKNCYVFRRDSLYGIDSRNVFKTKNFDLPLKRKRDGSYKIAHGEHVWTCFTSDFFVAEADEWRDEAWKMISLRKDLYFFNGHKT